MKKLCIALVAFFLCFLTFTVFGQKKVLIVISSYGKDKGKTRPGFELDELSQAYLIFKQHNLAIDIASPKGGHVEMDAFSTKKAYNNVFLEDTIAKNLLKNTKSTAQIINENYDALYIVGGKGAMFDLPFDPSLQDFSLKMYQQNKILAAVCHGAAAFVNTKINDSTHLVKNKRITGLCNEEETRFGKKWAKEFPFLLETKLTERKAIFEKGGVMLPFLVKDGNFITGQNPYSTSLVAEEIVKTLGIPLQKRQLFADENSMFLVKRAINGEYDWAVEELKRNKAQYEMELIAVYGYYGLKFANDNLEEVRRSLSIIDLAVPYYFNENLHYERATALKKLGDNQKAKTLLEELIAKKLLVKEAEKLLSEL